MTKVETTDAKVTRTIILWMGQYWRVLPVQFKNDIRNKMKRDAHKNATSELPVILFAVAKGYVILGNPFLLSSLFTIYK